MRNKRFVAKTSMAGMIASPYFVIQLLLNSIEKRRTRAQKRMLRDNLLAIFRSQHAVNTWMAKPNPSLWGMTPNEGLKLGLGGEILEILKKEHGYNVHYD